MFERLAPLQHDTLDGVPEPRETFALYGHAAAAGQLAQAYAGDKLHHALLFAGPQGVGKATLAFALARHMLAFPNRADRTPFLAASEPGSALFRQVAQAAHPGVLHLTRPYDDKRKVFKTMLTVEEIRRVSRFVTTTQHDGGWRVVIVDSADDMNAAAANALLKNLEEPPAKTLFIVISHAPGRLLPTIRSRCQLVRLGPLEPDDLAKAVSQATGGPAFDPAAVSAADGSVRAALLAVNHGGLELAAAADALLSARSFDPAAALKLGEAVSGRDGDIPFRLLMQHLLGRLAKSAKKAGEAGDLHRANRLASAWQAASAATGEAMAYNLDKKQHAAALLEQVHGLSPA